MYCAKYLVLRAIFKRSEAKKANDGGAKKKKEQINTDIYVMSKA